eukprot:4493467-Prymnesium_polylepis.1
MQKRARADGLRGFLCNNPGAPTQLVLTGDAMRAVAEAGGYATAAVCAALSREWRRATLDVLRKANPIRLPSVLMQKDMLDLLVINVPALRLTPGVFHTEQ